MIATIPHASSPLFVSSGSCKSVLTWPTVIEQLRKAYSTHHEDRANPRRSVARDGDSWIRALTSVPPVGLYMGVKTFGLGPKKTVNYVIVLIDRDSGLIAGLVDGAPITAMRTAATSALAMDALASKDARVLGVVGSGDEAFAHVQAIAQIRTITELRVFSPTLINRDKFARHFATALGISAQSVDTPDLAIDGADIVIAAARSRDETPILYGRHLKSGMAVVSIGSTLPEQREIDASVIDTCDLVVCDAVEEVCEETGDMLAARLAGVPFSHKTISLNQLLCEKVHQERAYKLPLFKSVGSALQDIVVAGLALELAIDAGLATELPIHFHVKRP